MVSKFINFSPALRAAQARWGLVRPRKQGFFTQTSNLNNRDMLESVLQGKSLGVCAQTLSAATSTSAGQSPCFASPTSKPIHAQRVGVDSRSTRADDWVLASIRQSRRFGPAHKSGSCAELYLSRHQLQAVEMRFIKDVCSPLTEAANDEDRLTDLRTQHFSAPSLPTHPLSVTAGAAYKRLMTIGRRSRGARVVG